MHIHVRVPGNTSTDLVEYAVIRNNVADSVANSGIYTWYHDHSMIYGNDINVLRGHLRQYTDFTLDPIRQMQRFFRIKSTI